MTLFFFASSVQQQLVSVNHRYGRIAGRHRWVRAAVPGPSLLANLHVRGGFFTTSAWWRRWPSNHPLYLSPIYIVVDRTPPDPMGRRHPRERVRVLHRHLRGARLRSATPFALGPHRSGQLRVRADPVLRGMRRQAPWAILRSSQAYACTTANGNAFRSLTSPVRPTTRSC